MGSTYPNSIDSAATLYSPVDAFSTKPLDTTASQPILAGDSTVSVASTDGFAATYGILSVDDELIVYVAKGGTQFTGCQRGAFGTQAAQHALGVAVKANMVSGFLTALQSAVLAIETELGTVAARNYVLAAGAQTVTGLKTFQDGVALGSGAKAATGLARLPNTGAIKWRNAANSGDLGMALDASDHLVMDAIVDFAGGQTFGAFSYPDATTTSKGIVQIDAVGGLAVAAGVASLAATGVVAGTYQKVTVDAKGRVTGGTTLVSGDLPAHTHVAGDVSSGAFGVPRGGTGITTYALGDLLYCSDADTLAKLAGNITTTRKFLRQTGTGSASAAPVWDALLSGDLPAHTHAESDVTSLVTDLAAKVAGAANLTTQYRMLCTSAAGTATESTTIATDAAGGLNLAKYLSLVEMTPPGTPATNTVRLYLEDLKGFSFLSFIDDTGMVRKLVRDSVFVAKNVSGSTIGIGKAVCASGSSGNVPTIVLAKSDETSTMPAIGITAEAIADGAFGRVMQVGLLEHINTNAFAEGDVVFVSDTTAGDLTTTIPLVPHLRQEIGTVLVKGIGNGTLQIVARSISQEDTGTRLNSWRVGDGTAGAKTVIFNNGADQTLSWNPSGAAKTITLPDLTGTVALGGSNLSTANAVVVVSSAGVVTETANLKISSSDLVAAVTTRVNGPLAFFECGAYQTVGGAFENILKRSEDFNSATWDKSGGSCTVVADNATAPDGNATADTVTAVSATAAMVQQQVAGLVDGGAYTFYVWAKVASGTKQISLAIVDNAYAGYLAGPTSIALTTTWQRFKITGTLAGGQTGLWVVVRNYTANSDTWTSGDIILWGACLQQGTDPKNGYARTWASQTSLVAAGVACGAVVISAKDNAESPLRIYGPGSNLADHTLVEVTAGGELIIAGGAGNGYRLAELMGATNPNGWAGVLKVKTPAGATAGYILLYSNP